MDKIKFYYTIKLRKSQTRLLTGFYKSPESQGISIPRQRVLAFKFLMQHKTICINPGELIVGERGTAPKATPTYPEICLHSLQDLEFLDSREKIPFSVDNETRELYTKEIIPFWKGKSIRDRIFNELPREWKDAYEAGIFTEFQEQRAPGHTVLGDKIYRKGFLDLKKEIENHLQLLDFFHDPEAYDKKEELDAMSIAADALMIFARRHGEKLKELAASETEGKRKKELETMAEICFHVPAHPPRNFHEALQYYWFVHLGVITELNPWDSFNPGRLDQHLYPFYKRELEQGTLTQERARELLQAFWVKFNNHPAPPKVGVTAKESNTEMTAALKADFNGFEELREKLVDHTPKYGNDNDYVDDIMKQVFDMFQQAVDGRPAGHYGTHHILMLPTTSHVYFGSVIGALPDGRKAGMPLSEGISPVQGVDKNGPTSVIKSAAKLDHIKTGGTLLNQKFIPQILKDDEGITKLLHLIRSYFKMDGHHM